MIGIGIEDQFGSTTVTLFNKEVEHLVGVTLQDMLTEQGQVIISFHFIAKHNHTNGQLYKTINCCSQCIPGVSYFYDNQKHYWQIVCLSSRNHLIQHYSGMQGVHSHQFV